MLKLLNKLFERLLLLTPGRRIYFIYTHHLPYDRFSDGLKANTEISYWSLHALKNAFPRVFFLSLQNEKKTRIRYIRSKDIVIGHVGETFLKASEKTKNLIAFYPWAGHEDRSVNTLFNCLPFEKEKNYWEKAESLILLTSEYNVREYVQQPRNFWYEAFLQANKKKSIRFVHQPIDLKIFKRIKTTYETSDFLYIGNNAHMKGLEDSKQLVRSVGRTLQLYGVGGNFLNHLDSNQVQSLPELADFFIQPGMWEGQCVSILESAARGFIPIVSPETGYPYEHPFLLKYGEFEYNLSILKKLLNTSSQERKELADTLHSRLIEDIHHNSWEVLGNVLVEEVKRLLNRPAF